jgi:tetratricopeptide (TPR) repeat protein
MNNGSMGELDALELLHLALQAMEEHRDADAIGFLKRGIALDPTEGRLHYLLGALHAQLGMYERATEELQRAVQHAPEIDMAHFQLGLLHLTAGDLDKATGAWAPLDRLAPEEPLALFVAGMLKLTDERYDECIELLRRGIAANDEHEALNRDMQRVIETAGRARDESAKTQGESADNPAQHVLLSGYRMGGPTG